MVLMAKGREERGFMRDSDSKKSKYSNGEPSAGMKGTRAACLAYVDLRNLVWSSCLSKRNSAVRIGDSGLLQVITMVAAQPLSLKPGSLLTSHAISCLMAHPLASQWNRGAGGRPCSSGHSSAPPSLPPFLLSPPASVGLEALLAPDQLRIPPCSPKCSPRRHLGSSLLLSPSPLRLYPELKVSATIDRLVKAVVPWIELMKWADWPHQTESILPKESKPPELVVQPFSAAAVLGRHC